MANLVIDYIFNSTTVANPDGSLRTPFTKAVKTTGPKRTTLGNFPHALDLSGGGKAKVDLSGIKPEDDQFCFQFIFKITSKVTSRQNLFESTLLPFAIFAVPGRNESYFDMHATVNTAQHAWSGADTFFKKALRVNSWYVGTVAFDIDTLSLSVTNTNGRLQLYSVHAFPNGKLKKGTGKDLFIGTWTNGVRDQFKGCMACFKWHDGIPLSIEQELDEHRNMPEWFISRKFEIVKRKFSPGKKVKAIQFDAVNGSHLQYYERCAIMYHPNVGTAFEMHGKIFEFFKNWPKRSSLGYLTTDESLTTRRGGRKSLFNKGGIYWSSATGAVPVLSDLYLSYENLGESTALGFPTKLARNISGGLEQEFQSARMYFRHGSSTAFEVHGAILRKFLSSGGINKWGYPISDEMDIKKGTTTIGKFSEFEHCTIYWSRTTGAFEVHGAIRRKYQEVGGPGGGLGFPTSDESDIPGYAGTGRINTFQKGSILWFGNETIIARPFKIFIGRVDSKEREGWGRGQNDIYFKYIRVKEGSHYLYNQRRPSSGSWSNRNVKNVNFTIPVTITPNSISKKIYFSVKLYDDDGWSSGDEFLGDYSKTLSAANAWGLRDHGGVYNVSFDYIKSFTWSVKPQVNLNHLSEIEKWWGVKNIGTSKITYSQYASAFRDVDSEREWWDITDWLEKAFYELVIEDIAEKGNCFGMSLEGIYARKNNSLFSMPINRFKRWSDLVNEFNIKHQYQVGASAVWWFVGQFLSGNTHDPKDVFNRSHSAFLKGNNPVICIAQNYDFSGKPHCIMPVGWSKSSKPWRMKIMDPNAPGKVKELTVNPDNNTFEYKGSYVYQGGEWSGGRFHYMPFSVLNRPPRTPIWDAILLLLAGTVIIFADDAETVSLTDENGKDLDGFGNRAKEILKSGRQPNEFFVGFQGFDRPTGKKPDQILLRKEPQMTFGQVVGPITLVDLPVIRHMKDKRFRNLANALKKETKAKNLIEGKTANQIVNNPEIKAKLPAEVFKEIQKVTKVNATRNFIHKMKGKRNGQFKYVVKHRLNEVQLETSIQKNEQQEIRVNDLGTNSNLVRLISSRDKHAKITVNNKLGVAGDFMKIEIHQVPLIKNKALELNVKSGFAGLEIINAGKKVNLPVRINARVDGQNINQNFTVPLEKGVRLKLSNVIFNKELIISNINNVFGPVISTRRVK